MEEWIFILHRMKETNRKENGKEKRREKKPTVRCYKEHRTSVAWEQRRARSMKSLLLLDCEHCCGAYVSLWLSVWLRCLFFSLSFSFYSKMRKKSLLLQSSLNALWIFSLPFSFLFSFIIGLFFVWFLFFIFIVKYFMLLGLFFGMIVFIRREYNCLVKPIWIHYFSLFISNGRQSKNVLFVYKTLR